MANHIYKPLNVTCRIMRNDGDDYPVIELADGRYITVSDLRTRNYPEDYCLADVAAYGACILTPNHSGDHKDANGYSFNGTDRKVRS